MGELRRLKIGPWTATPALNVLERGEQCVKLEPRAMDVLVALAERAGAVVSIEELLASVWKGVVVGDGSVYLAIRQLRQVLDDSSSGTRFIETIPKRGYRLTVPVEPEAIPAEAMQPPARPSVARPRRLWLGVACAIVAIVTAGVIALWGRAPAHTDKSVAVLPFENLSSDPEQDYFADGVTAEILNALAAVRGLRVTGQVSSFHFKNRSESPQAIAATLGVEHLLQGSVRKAGEQLRIAAQLTYARTGEQLWSESYERKLDDVFLIQDEIAKAVASALQVKLGVGDVGRVPGMTRDVAAYDEYLRGAAHAREWRLESIPLGIAHLQRAVAIDPSFSIAWYGLGMTYANGAGFMPSRAEEWTGLSNDALERARSLTPDAPHVLLSTGIIETRRGHWLAAARTFERAVASYSRYGMADQAWGPRGTFLVFVGRLREAVPLLERARAENPFEPNIAGYLGYTYAAGGDYDAAFAEIERGLALDAPDTPLRRAGLILALNKQDRRAIEERVRASSELPAALARLLDTPAEAAVELRRMAAAASPVEKTALGYWAAYFGEPELSLEIWAEGVRDPDGLWQPLMRDVRALPAFKEVVRELGLVDYWRVYGWSDFCRPVGDEDFSCS